jgi:hypothetical protein
VAAWPESAKLAITATTPTATIGSRREAHNAKPTPASASAWPRVLLHPTCQISPFQGMTSAASSKTPPCRKIPATAVTAPAITARRITGRSGCAPRTTNTKSKPPTDRKVAARNTARLIAAAQVQPV